MPRRAFLALLLLAEVATFHVAVDVAAAAAHAARAADSGSARQALLITLVVAMAWLVLGGPGSRRDVRGLLDGVRLAQRSPLFLPAHLAGFLAFLGVTVRASAAVIEAEPDAASQTLYFGWGLLAALNLAFWAANLVPRRAWRPLANAGLDVALAGAALSVPAVAFPRLGQFLWAPLGGSTLWMVRRTLSLLYPEVVYGGDAKLVGTPTFRVHISPGCSGYEGIGLICFFLALYCLVYRRELRWPAVLLLFPIGVALMWLSNVARIVALIAIGDGVSPDIALDGFHSHAGWVLLLGVGLGTIAVSRRLRFFTRLPGSAAVGPASTTGAFLAPLLALLATIMLTASFTAGFDLLYPLRVVAVAAVLLWYQAEYTRWDWRPSWQAVAIGVGVFFLWLAMEPPPDPAAVAKLIGGLDSLSPTWRAAWLTFRVVGSALTVPFAEELAFRGYLTRRLIAPDIDRVPIGEFSWLSCLASSALFGAMHGRWLAGALAGLAYAAALYRRRSLPDAVVAHATTNGLIAALALSGRWSLWC